MTISTITARSMMRPLDTGQIAELHQDPTGWVLTYSDGSELDDHDQAQYGICYIDSTGEWDTWVWWSDLCTRDAGQARAYLQSIGYTTTPIPGSCTGLVKQQSYRLEAAR